MDVGNVGLTDQDVCEAMKSIPGYLDITHADFKELCCRACLYALERVSKNVLTRDMIAKHVVFVLQDTPLEVVAKLMCHQGISGVPVTDTNQTVAGMISERDFLVRMGEAVPKNFMIGVAARGGHAQSLFLQPESHLVSGRLS
jgi:CBS domain-containing membrane protein